MAEITSNSSLNVVPSGMAIRRTSLPNDTFTVFCIVRTVFYVDSVGERSASCVVCVKDKKQKRSCQIKTTDAGTEISAVACVNFTLFPLLIGHEFPGIELRG